MVAVDYQPRLRKLLEDSIGHSATDAVLSVAMVVAHVLELSPTSLAVDLAMEILKAAEYPGRSAGLGSPRTRAGPPCRTRRGAPAVAAGATGRGPGRAARPAQRLVQVVGTAAVGPFTRNLAMAATAALVTTPKATRTTRESFAAALGQGLAEQHEVLPLRPEKLRWLDRVDALLIDPRVLCTDTLRVVRVRGADEDELTPGVEPRPAAAGEEGTHRLAGIRSTPKSRSADRPDARPAGLSRAGRGATRGPGADLGRDRGSRRAASGVRRPAAPATGTPWTPRSPRRWPICRRRATPSR